MGVVAIASTTRLESSSVTLPKIVAARSQGRGDGDEELEPLSLAHALSPALGYGQQVGLLVEFGVISSPTGSQPPVPVPRVAALTHSRG